MDEVIIDAVRSQAAQLLVEDAIEVRLVLARRMGKLGREKHLVAQAQVLERRTHHGLVSRIQICRVKIVDAALDGARNDGLRPALVGPAGHAARKPHAAEP